MLVPSRPETMFMTTGIALYRSDYGGGAWERLTGAEFRLAYPDHIVISPDEKTLFMSGAAGHPVAWRKTTTPAPRSCAAAMATVRGSSCAMACPRPRLQHRGDELCRLARRLQPLHRQH